MVKCGPCVDEPCETGDAFVVAPDGSRAGLVWEVGAARDRTGLTFGAGAVGCLGCLVPAPYENPRRCTEQPRYCIARFEGSLGRMEAVVLSPAAMIVENPLLHSQPRTGQPKVAVGVMAWLHQLSPLGGYVGFVCYKC